LKNSCYPSSISEPSSGTWFLGSPCFSDSANKLIRIAEVCKNKFIKVEHEHAEKYANHESKMEKTYEEKFAIFETGFEQLETKRIEEYVTIDAKVETLTNNIEEYKMRELKLSLERMNENLEAFKQLFDDDKPEAVDKDIRKTCRFHNKVHCNKKDSGAFFHANTICEIFRETGACWKQVCREQNLMI
jgi:hypothetical protein